MTETREERLLRTSEVYRRLHARVLPDRQAPVIDLGREATPPDTARALPQAPSDPDAHSRLPSSALPPPGPGFVRRMLTRRLDLREIVLLALVLAALIAGGN